ncbi:unnamed protein product [Effrenium voratum]|nr:unnamed protein product [Effrenium voratum]
MSAGAQLFSWAKSHGAVIRDGWKALQALDRCDRTCQAVHDLPEGERERRAESRPGTVQLVPQLGALLPFLFWGEGSPTKNRQKNKIGYPYSKLSTGGPSLQAQCCFGFLDTWPWSLLRLRASSPSS